MRNVRLWKIPAFRLSDRGRRRGVRVPGRAALTGAAIALLASAGAALAGPPGKWTRITETNQVNVDEVGTTRSPDGVAHVLWQRHVGPGSEAIMHTRITPNGSAGPAYPVVSGLAGADDPDVVITPDGRLRAFFMGLGTTFAEGGVVAANGSGSGTDWVRDGVRVSSSVSAVGPVGAAVASSGAPLFSYAYAFRLAWHTGLDPNVPDTEVQQDNLCCDYQPDLATDAATGQTVLAWFSNATGRTGTWVRTVIPPGGPVLAPGSVASGGQAVNPDQRTSLVGRTGGGVYAGYCGGYPTCTKALVWRVGTGAAMVGGAGTRIEDVRAAAGPLGRIWISWHDGNRLFVRRSNKAVTKFGPVVRVNPPGGTNAIWKLTGEGSVGLLDLFTSVSTPGSLATWHTQVRPPLSLVAVKGGTKVTFTVTDAGDPVAGAKVKFGAKTLTTKANGKVTTAKPSKKTIATATKSGYQPKSVAVTP